MKKLRDVPPRYLVAALFFGGMSLLLFGVVFALVRQADHAAANQAWAWVVIAALIALVAAMGAFCGLVAWGALSDPKSRLGAWAQKMPLADAVETAACLLISDPILWAMGVGSLFFLPRSYSSFIGVAAISCGVLILLLVAWRALKADIKASTIHLRAG